MNRKEIRDKIVQWNVNFPIDRVWREKHNVAFNSKEHRETSFLDQLFEMEEDAFFKELFAETEYKPNIGDFFKEDKTPKTMEQLISEAKEELEELPDLELPDGE
jgi:hypothetical protein